MSYLQESPLETDGDYKLNETDNLPVKNRRKTDVFCTIVNTTFVVLLLLIFIFTFNGDNLNRITYPNDAEGTLCGFDAPKYPYLYYASLTDPVPPPPFRPNVSAWPSAPPARISPSSASQLPVSAAAKTKTPNTRSTSTTPTSRRVHVKLNRSDRTVLPAYR